MPLSATRTLSAIRTLVPVPLTGSGIMTRMDDRDAGEGLGGYVGQVYAELPTVTWSLSGIMMASCRGSWDLAS